MAAKNLKRVIVILLLLVSIPVIVLPTVGQTPDPNPIVYLPVIYGPPPEPPTWIGPYGGKIIAIAIAPSQPEIIYAGTWGSGIFKSTDGGNTWVWKSHGLGTPYINSMAVDPADPQTVYAGTYRGKVYKTVDGADHWFQSSKNIQAEAIVYSMVIDPLDTENIYIGTRGISNNGGPPWNGVLYRTTDAGANWEPVLTNVGGSSEEDWAYSVTLHPRFPNIIFAATHEHGAYRSTNSGRDWVAINIGVTNLSGRALVVDPHSSTDNAVVYMGVWKYTGVFKTINGGNSWYLQDNGSSEAQIYNMSIDPQNSNQVYASTFSIGVIKTENGGNSWFTAGLADEEVAGTAVNPQNPNMLFSGTNGGGLFKSTNAGDTWVHSQKGLHATRVNSVQVSWYDPQRLFACISSDGVHQTLDGGENWSQLGSGLDNINIFDLVTNPANPNFLFALTEVAGLYRCDLGGACWQSVPINFPYFQQMDSTFDVDHPFAQLPLLEPWLERDNEPTAIAQNPDLLSIVFAPSNAQIAYLGTSGAGLYKSSDNGNTWQPTSLTSEKIVSIAVHPQYPDSVLVATPDKVLHSGNGGSDWTDLGLSDLEIYGLTLDSTGNIYAGTNDGVYRYFAGVWTRLALEGLAVTEISSHPSEAGWLYAGTTNGLYISRNYGQIWGNIPWQLAGKTVQAISFDPDNPAYFYVSTKTHGVMRVHDPY
jgi:photosystem II stability/assembly factor-like uncharacterized protein